MQGAELRSALLSAASAMAPASSDADLDVPADPDPPAARAAAVLVAVQPDGRLWLTRRSPALTDHAGQIALPGGKIEPGDAGPEACALREAEEEIGLPAGAVEVLGRLAPHATVTGFAVTPVLGWVAGEVALRPRSAEVAEVFSVPFVHVADLRRYSVGWRAWGGGRRHFYAVPYGDYYIWGATARILRGLAERLPTR